MERSDYFSTKGVVSVWLGLAKPERDDGADILRRHNGEGTQLVRSLRGKTVAPLLTAKYRQITANRRAFAGHNRRIVLIRRNPITTPRLWPASIRRNRCRTFEAHARRMVAVEEVSGSVGRGRVRFPWRYGGSGHRTGRRSSNEGILMSVGSVLIGLQASGGDRDVTSAAFLVPLNLQPGEFETARADGGSWASGMVYLAVVRYSAFAHVDTTADAGAQSEAFYAGVVEAFRAAGRFLDRREPDVTAGMRAAGLKLRLFVDVRMDQDQMELELPPELLAACGRHALGVYVISNDIPAAEVRAQQAS